MRKEFLKEMKSKLGTMKSKLEEELSKEILLDSQGDETDHIQATILANVDLALSARKRGQIKKIDIALEKIAAETYGVCISCQDDIAEKRLSYTPWFDTCVDCASDREAQAKTIK